MNQIADIVPVLEPLSHGVVFETKRRRREKNLIDAIMTAFHSACDLKDTAVAWRLLQSLENTISLHSNDTAFNHRRALAVLVAGHERLWDLRHE